MATKDLKAVSHALVDADDRVVSDILCVNCGWNLRSYKVGENCPNCTHSISDSVFGDYLVHSDPKAVRQLADAAWMVVCGAGLLLLLVAAAALATLFTADNASRAVTTGYNMIFAGAVVSPVPAAVGLVLLTPRRSLAYYTAWLRMRYGARRAQIELGIKLAVALGILVTVSVYYGWIVGRLAMVLWFAVPLACFFRGVEQLMRRLPNPQLATYARLVLIGALVFSAFAFAILVLERVRVSDPDVEDTLVGLASVNLLLGGGIGIAAFRLLLRVHNALRRAAR